ncbi:MAG: hypothetical protein LR015_00795 [Verrucomicrobia bacterium]|nr:hypothetical protein [Verrucomicrobiota bacterium]
MYEGFNYPDGNLANSSGGSGWLSNAGWGSFPRGNGIHTGIGGSSAMVVEAQTLNAPINYALQRSGRQLNSTTGYNWAFREFAPENRIDMDAGDTVYFSYLFSMRNISTGAGSYCEIIFINADRTELFRLGVGNRSLVPTISAPDNTAWVSGTRLIEPQVSYLLVGRIIPGPTNDVISIQLYSEFESIAGEPEVWELEVERDIRFSLIDRIGLVSGGLESGIDHTSIYDELRFGTSFEAVTGVSGSAETPMWAGYPWLNDNADVQTGNFLGLLNVAAQPWVWSYAVTNWMYANEDYMFEEGAWIYLTQPAQ